MNKLRQRVISALVLVTVFGLALLVDHTGVVLAFGLIVLLASMEYVAMVKPGNHTLAPALGAVAVYMAFYTLSQVIEFHQYIMLIYAFAGIHLLVFITILFIKSNRPLRSFFPGLFAIAVAAGSIHYFQYFEQYRIDIFILLSLTWASDTGSYFVGKYYGKRQLAPVISPNKTVEGFIGGFLLSFLFSAVLIVTNIKDWRLWIVAACVHLFVVGGDLLESKVKRIVKVKDSGSLIPGHGGVLDRSDGMLYSLPFGILMYHYLLN